MKSRQDAPAWVRHLLVLSALGVIGLLLIIPALNVLYQAFGKGISAYFSAIADRETLHAIFLTSLVAVVSMVVNTVFGVAASWAITKYEFWGKSLLITLIDLPFSVSPVVSGLIYVLTFGVQTTLGSWLDAHNIQILFAAPGIVIATTFVTFPFVAREVMPVMEAIGNDQEEASLTLGASGWQTFRLITLPNIKWGVIYGVILCGSRAMGEYGAVSVISSRIAGQTDTLSLRVEKLYHGYQAPAAFAVASLLLFLAFITLGIKTAVEWKVRRTLAEAARREEPA
ncbi:MAG TPA: sulfate ABC transporter permease subunit CysW [Planctomycetota bacterium]|jgi:sulfate transport system permease protein|nr:sulfate ABC transporter permease subunit CysW [Planctomycetota bacterium]